MNFRKAGAVSADTKGGASGLNTELVFSQASNCQTLVQTRPNKELPSVCE